MTYQSPNYPKLDKKTLEINLQLFVHFCQNFNIKKNIDNINFLLSHQFNPVTINNHIIPAGHYYNWLSINNKQKKGSNKSRNRSINLIDLNSSLVSSVVLDKFSSKDFIFTQELETLFTNAYIDGIHNKINTEKIGSIDNLVNKIKQNLIKSFWLYQTRSKGEFIIDWNQALHVQQRKSLVNEIEVFAKERAEKNLYFSFLVARDKFYEIDKNSKNPSETALKIIKIVKQSHKKYYLLIEAIVKIFLFYLFIEKFAISNKNFGIINHISEFKKVFDSYWDNHKNKIIKKFKNQILDKLMKFLSQNEYQNSYICSLINSLFITINVDNQHSKQRKSAYLFIYNKISPSMMTREKPLLTVDYDRTYIFKNKIPKKEINKRVFFIAYHPHLLVMSGGIEMINMLNNAYQENQNEFSNYYNLVLLTDSNKNKLKIVT